MYSYSEIKLVSSYLSEASFNKSACRVNRDLFRICSVFNTARTGHLNEVPLPIQKKNQALEQKEEHHLNTAIEFQDYILPFDFGFWVSFHYKYIFLKEP